MHAADERNGGSSYCAQVCCDSLKEEPCYDYDDVGNVKQYCAAVRKNHILSIFIDRCTSSQCVHLLQILSQTINSCPTEVVHVPKVKRSAMQVCAMWFISTIIDDLFPNFYFRSLHLFRLLRYFVYQTRGSVWPATTVQWFVVTSLLRKHAPITTRTGTWVNIAHW